MSKKSNNNSFIQRPEYPGGSAALVAFLKSNLKYPEEALKSKIEGKVYVEVEIDFKGNVYHNKVINGIGYGCDEEALRLTKLLKYSSPNNKGMRVQVKRKINVLFQLPRETNKDLAVNYTIKPKENQDIEEQKPNSTTINYTISW